MSKRKLRYKGLTDNVLMVYILLVPLLAWNIW